MWRIKACLHSFLSTVLDGGERSTAGQDRLAPGRGLTSPSLHVFLPYIMNKESIAHKQPLVTQWIKWLIMSIMRIHDRSPEHKKEYLLGSDKSDIPLKTLEMVCNLWRQCVWKWIHWAESFLRNLEVPQLGKTFPAFYTVFLTVIFKAFA